MQAPVFGILFGAIVLGFSGNTKADALGEVIVTAQKRAEHASDVGLSIVVLSEAHARGKSVQSVQDLEVLVPGLRSLSSGSSVSTLLTLRGAGQRDVSPTSEGAVAVYVDDSYNAFNSAIGAPLYDIERIEIVKGPQGSTFGRNATGGLIQVITREPSELDSGQVQGSIGSFDQLGLQGVFNSAITDSMATRLSYYHQRHNGWIKNSAGPDGNSARDTSIRAQLLYRPSERLRWRLIGNYREAQGQSVGHAQSAAILNPATGEEVLPPTQSAYVAFCNAIASNGGLATLMGYSLAPEGSIRSGNCFSAEGTNPFQRSYGEAPYSVTDRSLSSRVHYDAERFAVTSIASVQESDSRHITDTDGTTLPLFLFAQEADGQRLSHELRATASTRAWSWIAGLNAERIRLEGETLANLRELPTTLAAFGTQYKQSTSALAVFAQTHFKLQDHWTVVLGARVSNESKSLQLGHSCSGNPVWGQVPVSATATLPVCDFLAAVTDPRALQFAGDRTLREEWTDGSGRAQLEYRPSDAQLWYLGVSRGSKSGGFNVAAPQFYPAEDATFEPEVLTSFELGHKRQWPTLGLSLQTAAFFYDYANLQSFQIVDTQLRTINVSSKVKGAEFDLQRLSTLAWTYGLGVTFLDAQSRVPWPTAATLLRQRNPESPRWSAVAHMGYRWKLHSGQLMAQVHGSFVSARSSNAIDAEVLRLASAHRFDARLILDASNNWRYALGIENISNERLPLLKVSLAPILGSIGTLYSSPRTAKVSISKSW